MAFIVFSVSLAIVRNMFNRMMEQMPDEKNRDWKKAIKRKIIRDKPKKQVDDKKESLINHQYLPASNPKIVEEEK